MSICNECWGKGWIKKQGVQFDCSRCKGTGVIENEPQTNEEWFDSLSTEEKAEWLADHMKCSKCPQQNRCNGYHGGCVALMLEWLKQPHQGA